MSDTFHCTYHRTSRAPRLLLTAALAPSLLCRCAFAMGIVQFSFSVKDDDERSRSRRKSALHPAQPRTHCGSSRSACHARLLAHRVCMRLALCVM